MMNQPNGLGFEAELTDIALPLAVGIGFGPTTEETVTDLRQKVKAYIEALQQADFTILP